MKLTPKQSEALQMQESGLTYSQIAEQLGISTEAVNVRLAKARRQLGLPVLRLRAKSQLTSRQKQVLKLKEQGLKNSQIAERLGIKPITVKEHARNAKRRVEEQQS